MGEFAPVRKNGQVGVYYNNLWRRACLPVREAKAIYPAKRCRPCLKFPNEAVSVRLPATRACDAVLQNVILLGGRKFPLVVSIHALFRRTSFSEKFVHAYRDASPCADGKPYGR